MKRDKNILLACVLLLLVGCAPLPQEQSEVDKELIAAYEQARETAMVVVETGEDVYEGVYLEEDYTPEEQEETFIEEPAEEQEEVVEEVEEVIVEEPITEWVEPLEAWQGAIPDEYLENPEEQYVETYTEPYVEERVSYGDCLTALGGVYWFGDQKETWYNLDMSGIVSSIQNRGWLWNDIAEEYKENVAGEYWVREDGCKMLGDYIMVAANLSVHPRGSLVETSLGTGVVVDTGGFAVNNPLQIDIAVNW